MFVDKNIIAVRLSSSYSQVEQCCSHKGSSIVLVNPAIEGRAAHETSGETTTVRTWFGRLMLLALLAMMAFALHMPLASVQDEDGADDGSSDGSGVVADDCGMDDDGFGFDDFPFGGNFSFGGFDDDSGFGFGDDSLFGGFDDYGMEDDGANDDGRGD